MGVLALFVGCDSKSSGTSGSTDTTAVTGGASGNGGQGTAAGGKGGSGTGGSKAAGGAAGGIAGGGGIISDGGQSDGGTASGGGAGAGGNQGGSGGGSSGAGGGTTSTGVDGGATALRNPAPGSALFIGVNFWRIDWEGAADFFVAGADFTTISNPWNPKLLTDLAPFRVLRFMDWNLTNDSNNPQADWTKRKLKTQSQTSEPIAFEWQIDLCNRMKADYWVTVPHEANLTTYPANLAKLIHDQLDPSLRVYVEWSNEVWNSGFPQNGYAKTQGTSLALAGSNPALAYQVYASVRVWEAFESAFADSKQRVVKVLSGQHVWEGPCTALTTALADATVNPKGTQPTAFAVAPYFSGTTLPALQTSVTDASAGLDKNATCAKAKGLPLISYEGGSDSFAAGNGCTAVQTNPGMAPIYTSYLDMLSAHLKGPFMQYTGFGGCWGLKVRPGDSDVSSPKYKAVTDWLVAHP
jgi:hypothetical protein